MLSALFVGSRWETTAYPTRQISTTPLLDGKDGVLNGTATTQSGKVAVTVDYMVNSMTGDKSGSVNGKADSEGGKVAAMNSRKMAGQKFQPPAGQAWLFFIFPLPLVKSEKPRHFVGIPNVITHNQVIDFIKLFPFNRNLPVI